MNKRIAKKKYKKHYRLWIQRERTVFQSQLLIGICR